LNADAKNPPLAALSSADVQTRIDDERSRLLIEQNLEHDLTGQRIAPLRRQRAVRYEGSEDEPLARERRHGEVPKRKKR